MDRKGIETNTLLLLILGIVFLLFMIAWYALDLNVSLGNLFDKFADFF